MGAGGGGALENVPCNPMFTSHQLPSRPGALAAAGGMMVAACTTLLTRAKWVEVPLPLLLGVGVLISALLVRIAVLLRSRRQRHKASSRMTHILANSVALFGVGLLAVVPARFALTWYDGYKAKRFCDFLTPFLERYRAEHGRYPESVASYLLKQPKLPKLIEKGFQYYGTDDSFALHIMIPDRPFAWEVFDSKKGTWETEFD